MKRPGGHGEGWRMGAIAGGAALVGGVLLTLAAWPRAHRLPSAWDEEVGAAPAGFTDADVEAAARMLASENPRGSRALHIEQVHTQLRACKPGQSLYTRITAGSGWGPQGGRSPGGDIRPVSTVAPATPALRQLVREILAGVHPSRLPGARQFFEPAAQDRAFALAERARKRQAAGQPLSPEEMRLLGYRRSAEAVRRKWQAEGAQYLGTVEGVEFFG